MKNYTVSGVLADLSSAIRVDGKLIHVEKSVGINSWGKLDFLSKSGYTIIA